MMDKRVARRREQPVSIHLQIRQLKRMASLGALMVTHKIACIGAGYWGKNLVRNFTDLGALAWVCEMEPSTRAHLAAAYPTARFTDAVDQVLADPEVAGVAIATPAETHTELVR